MNAISIFDTIFDDMMNGFDQTSNYASCVYAPRVDVKSEDKAYTLEMDLPGRSENDVNIELDGKTLTVSSKEEKKAEDTKDEKSEEKPKWLIRERRNMAFKRSFTLPEDVNHDEISANFKNGVLTIVMPREEKKLPKKISIFAA